MASSFATIFLNLFVTSPAWTDTVNPYSEEIWLVRKDLPRFAISVRQNCPNSLRKYNVWAPDNFLELA
jgi:hypothetical protein